MRDMKARMIMKKIKNNYTNFILTVIAVAMIGILFKGEKIITSAHAIESHQHDWDDIFVGDDYYDFGYLVKRVVERSCYARGNVIWC